MYKSPVWFLRRRNTPSNRDCQFCVGEWNQLGFLVKRTEWKKPLTDENHNFDRFCREYRGIILFVFKNDEYALKESASYENWKLNADWSALHFVNFVFFFFHRGALESSGDWFWVLLRPINELIGAIMTTPGDDYRWWGDWGRPRVICLWVFEKSGFII